MGGEFLEKRQTSDFPDDDEEPPDPVTRSGDSTPSVEGSDEVGGAAPETLCKIEVVKKEDPGKLINKNKKKKQKKNKKKMDKGSLTENDLYEEPVGVKIYQQEEQNQALGAISSEGKGNDRREKDTRDEASFKDEIVSQPEE